MLKCFTVEGYRNFSHKLSLDLADTRDYQFNANALCGKLVKCGLLYGRNAVGKTNFSNALFDIKSNISRGLPLSDEKNYLSADENVTMAKFEYLFTFNGHEVRYEYHKTSRRTLVTERLFVDATLIFDFDHIASRMTQQDLAFVGAEHLNWNFRDREMSVFSYICNNTPSENLGPLYNLYVFIMGMNPISDAYISNRRFVGNIIEKVILNDRISALESYLNYFGIEEKLRVIESPTGDPVLYFVHDRLVPFVENCSSGTVALLRLFNYFETVQNPSLLFVDEFDAFYHHDLAEKVVNYFKQNTPHQVLCASHNTDLFSNKILRPDCLFILSKGHITSAADATKRELREGHNLEKLYKSGEFDG